MDNKMQENKKLCTKCKQTKSLSMFYARGNKKQSRCKKCVNKITYKYINENRTKIKESLRILHRNIRTRVIDKYGKICACCGESKIEFLAIDHINKDGAKHRKSGMRGGAFYRFLDKNPKQKGLRVLCHNCNMSIGMYKYCPHDTMSR